MGKRYLVDSNAVIDFCNGILPENGKNLLKGINPEISIITNIEIFSTTDISEQEYLSLKKFVSISIVHPIEIDLVQNTINIRQTYKIKLPDALIAATALVHGLTLISRNAKDFKNIDGLDWINPYEI